MRMGLPARKPDNNCEFAESSERAVLRAEIKPLYMNPHENALLISVDEKIQMHTQDHEHRKPIKEGSPEKIDSHYRRHGVLSLFAALFIQRCDVLGKTAERRRHQEFI